MAKFRVLITDYAWPDLTIEREELAAVDAELIEAPDGSEATLVRLAAHCQAIFNNWAKVTRNVICAAPELKIVSRMGVGLDSIDMECCTERGVLVTNVPDYCYREVAEHTLALLLCLARKIHLYRDATRLGRYSLEEHAPFSRLEGQTLGIVGFGRIGQSLAARACGLGMRVCVYSRTVKADEAVVWISLEELLTQSDYVALCVPLTAETRHIIGRAEFALMKPSAYLINTARGGLVDHAALADALQRNALAGAALDVHEPEPPNLLLPPWNDPRVLSTPHTAFVSVESLRELRRRAAKQVASALSGSVPEYVCNPQVLHRDIVV